MLEQDKAIKILKDEDYLQAVNSLCNYTDKTTDALRKICFKLQRLQTECQVLQESIQKLISENYPLTNKELNKYIKKETLKNKIMKFIRKNK